MYSVLRALMVSSLDSNRFDATVGTSMTRRHFSSMISKMPFEEEPISRTVLYYLVMKIVLLVH
jgi:hypothetical protein